MAPRKGKETLLDLCRKATVQGNTISVRMLEYLSSVKHLPAGFKELANDFLDICRILWSIEAGLSETARAHSFPPEMVLELDRKFRQTNDDFVVLNQMLLKFLDNERKGGGFGKLSKAWRMMSADAEIGRMRENLSKAREALRMSALVFRWSIGDAKADASVGIGFTGLAAALERMNARNGSMTVAAATGGVSGEDRGRSGAFENGGNNAGSNSNINNNSSNSGNGMSRQPASPPLASSNNNNNGNMDSYQSGSELPPQLPPVTLMERRSESSLLPPMASTTREPVRDDSHIQHSLSTHGRDGHGSMGHGGGGSHGGGNGGLTLREVLREDGHHHSSYHHPGIMSHSHSQPQSVAPVPSHHSHSHTGHGTHSSTARDDSNYHLSSYGGNTERQSSRATSVRSSKVVMSNGGRPSMTDHRPVSRNASLQADPLIMEDDLEASSPGTSETLIEDVLMDMDLNEKGSHMGGGGSPRVTRIKVDTSTVPRWTPRHSSGANSPQLKAALVSAVQSRQHKTIEQLLDRGVPADCGGELNLLREAVLNRDSEAVRLLLLFGADANGFDKHGWTALYTATEMSLVEIIKMLLKYGADPNMTAGPDSESPLAYVVEENRADYVQLFLAYGGDPGRTLNEGDTIFIHAMNKKTPRKIAELMLAYGVDPNAKNGEGKTAMFEAIGSGRVDLVSLLLDHGADPNLPGPKHLLWPSTYQPPCLKVLLARGADAKKCSGIMELATSINKLDSVRILIKAGVDVNAKKDGAYTPLCTAIRDNRGELVSLLLSSGADPNLMASELPAWKCVTHHRVQFLPQLVQAGADLHVPKGIVECAVHHGNKDALIFLLDSGVNPNDKTRKGHTALTTAIRDNKQDLVELLLTRGADPAIRGDEWPLVLAVQRPAILKALLPHIPDATLYKGVLERAVVADELESIKLLLDAGVSVEDRNGGVFSPLTTAIREDRRVIAKFLLDEAGANVNSPGEHLPLVKSIRRHRGDDDLELIEMLLVRGADVNLLHRGWNAVMQAVENGDSTVLKLLIEKGNPIDLQVKDETGRTIVDMLASRDWEEGSALLLGSSASNGLEHRR